MVEVKIGISSKEQLSNSFQNVYMYLLFDLAISLLEFTLYVLLGSPVVRTQWVPTARAQVQSLVGEPGSHLVLAGGRGEGGVVTLHFSCQTCKDVLFNAKFQFSPS